jgi:hypothetical protein
MRIPPAETLDSAFKSTEFEREIRPDLTFSYENVAWQLPRNAVINSERNPFVDWIGQKVTIVWPTEADYFVMIGPNKTAYEIDRRAAKADRAGEFQATPESEGQVAMKSLKETADVQRAARLASGEHAIVPGIHVDFELPAAAMVGSGTAGASPASAGLNTVSVMPRKKEVMNPDLLAALTEPGTVPPSMINGRPIDYWTAFSMLVDEGALTAGPEDKAWLWGVFNGRDTMPDTEMRAALEARTASGSDRIHLAEVKSA